MKLGVLTVPLGGLSLDEACRYLSERGVQMVEIGCGGCPGKKVILRVRELIKRGADTIAFATCIQKGAPIGYPCPFAAKMQALVEKEAGENVKILDHTH